jgi:hypothetical protein
LSAPAVTTLRPLGAERLDASVRAGFHLLALGDRGHIQVLAGRRRAPPAGRTVPRRGAAAPAGCAPATLGSAARAGSDATAVARRMAALISTASSRYCVPVTLRIAFWLATLCLTFGSSTEANAVRRVARARPERRRALPAGWYAQAAAVAARAAEAAERDLGPVPARTLALPADSARRMSGCARTARSRSGAGITAARRPARRPRRARSAQSSRTSSGTTSRSESRSRGVS